MITVQAPHSPTSQPFFTEVSPSPVSYTHLIMAGLACGEGNTIGWDILKNHLDVFASCPDWMSAKATRIYANPLEGDPHIVSGESGSVPLGLCYTALHDKDAEDLKKALKLDESSNILVISTDVYKRQTASLSASRRFITWSKISTS